jgi:type I restriction enzyme M protein
MRADDNTKNALKYLEQLTWLLFLQVFDSVEDKRARVAKIDRKSYRRIIDKEHRWATWARSSVTGPTLIDFVTTDLLPYLRDLKGTPQSEKIAQIFGEIRTVMKSGYSLREVIAKVDEIDFHSLENHHAMSVIYESLLAQTANAGWPGEFYTPRPIVESMVRVVAPKVGETVYDPCSGSCGFLVSAAEYMAPLALTTENKALFTNKTLYGQEAGEVAALVGTMNLMLHGIDDPQVVRMNTLVEQDTRNIPVKDQHNVILTNPPFGGTEHAQVQKNFVSKSGATELLFLQHCMAKLKKEGRCAIVLPDGILYRTEAAFSTVRRRLLNEFKVTGIVRLPTGVFPTAADTRCNLIYFENSGRTEAIRYYQIHPPVGKQSYDKGLRYLQLRRPYMTNPLTTEVLRPAEKWIVDGVADNNSWEVSYDELVEGGMDLDIAWPGSNSATENDAPAKLAQMAARVETLTSLTAELQLVQEQVAELSLSAPVLLGPHVEERGERAGSAVPSKYVRVTNAGGLAPFKGKPSPDTSRYRRLEKGDFVYNPMRVNVGSIALCRKEDEAGWVSPEYVVFRLTEVAPFDSEFLLQYLNSERGQFQIVKESHGAVRRRLYYSDLEALTIPVPEDKDRWQALIGSFAALRRHIRELAEVTGQALGSLEAELFSIKFTEVDGR